MGDHPLTPTLMLVGPSQIGKDSLMRRLWQDHGFDIHVNATSRPPRSDADPSWPEYQFMSKIDFQGAILGNRFLDWAYYAGQYYGVTPRNAHDQRPVMHCGAAMSVRIVQKYRRYTSVFMRPVNVLEHRRRIESRFEGPVARRRIEMMEEELDHASLFDKVIDVRRYCSEDDALVQLLDLIGAPS